MHNNKNVESNIIFANVCRTSDKVVRPKPRHSLPGSRPTSATTSQDPDAFNSTTTIRQAIFDEWRRARDKEVKQREAEKKKKEEEEKKKKEEVMLMWCHN